MNTVQLTKNFLEKFYNNLKTQDDTKDWEELLTALIEIFIYDTVEDTFQHLVTDKRNKVYAPLYMLQDPTSLIKPYKGVFLFWKNNYTSSLSFGNDSSGVPAYWLRIEGNGIIGIVTSDIDANGNFEVLLFGTYESLNEPLNFKKVTLTTQNFRQFDYSKAAPLSQLTFLGMVELMEPPVKRPDNFGNWTSIMPTSTQVLNKEQQHIRDYVLYRRRVAPKYLDKGSTTLDHVYPNGGTHNEVENQGGSPLSYPPSIQNDVEAKTIWAEFARTEGAYYSLQTHDDQVYTFGIGFAKNNALNFLIDIVVNTGGVQNIVIKNWFSDCGIAVDTTVSLPKLHIMNDEGSMLSFSYEAGGEAHTQITQFLGRKRSLVMDIGGTNYFYNCVVHILNNQEDDIKNVVLEQAWKNLNKTLKPILDFKNTNTTPNVIHTDAILLVAHLEHWLPSYMAKIDDLGLNDLATVNEQIYKIVYTFVNNSLSKPSKNAIKIGLLENGRLGQKWLGDYSIDSKGNITITPKYLSLFTKPEYLSNPTNSLVILTHSNKTYYLPQP
ncbi:MAG: hypothetical protein ACKVTZ_18345 [Bacteroidia bacterium]